ncbi:hypothetical protein [Streptomyces sp. NPDC012746]|uniref:hypothetical protein n=1 Tax=Streptomyces sp. NPDC012746 TaxID=3364845 RepID=UPI00369A510A
MAVNVLYINGPVQNGSFTIAGRPGKAAGIRAAEALNAFLDAGPVPHLWNTVTLAGDLLHRDAPDRDTVGLSTERLCLTSGGNGGWSSSLVSA